MVSLIGAGQSRDSRGNPFPRRRDRPWQLLTAVLAVVALGVWVLAFTSHESDITAMNCNSPTPAPGKTPPAQLGDRKAPSLLTGVDPAALSTTKIRVFNANGERGQAAHVASELSDLGFGSAAGDPVANDPVYVEQNMQCPSQIRFGNNGRSTASALQLVAPCSELIEDKRSDDSVDLALGTVFRDLKPNEDAQEVLHALRDPAPGVKPPPLDSDLLKAARKATC